MRRRIYLNKTARECLTPCAQGWAAGILDVYVKEKRGLYTYL